MRKGTLLWGIMIWTITLSGAEWVVTGSTTSIQFNHLTIDDLGLTFETIQTTAEPIRSDGIAFEGYPFPSLVFEATDADFEGLGVGSLRHDGGFILRRGNQIYSLMGFELHTGVAPNEMIMTDRDGHPWFWLRYSHPYLLPEESKLLLLKMDLILTDEFAQRIGSPAFTEMVVGTIELRVDVGVPPDFEPGRGTCEPDFAGDVDVELTSIGNPSQFVRQLGKVVIASSASLANVGTADVAWYRSIAPDGGVPPQLIGQHPYLVQHFYRIHNGILEQLGRSDLKHAFFAVNSGCSCQGAQVLFVGCSDVYGASTNIHRRYLAPRSELTANTGAWQSLGSHFDGPPVDDFRHHDDDDHISDIFAHRLVVQDADLAEPGADFFMEMWYLVKDDIDIFNSMGYRQTQPSLVNFIWTFSSPNPKVAGPVIDAWVDPMTPTTHSINTTIESGGGHLKLAVRVSEIVDQGGSGFVYEYALMNLDFDRKIDRFTIPITQNAVISSTGSGRPGNPSPSDWTASVTPTEITWSAPVGAELDWGTLVNFRFQASLGPAESQATLGVSALGQPPELQALTRTTRSCFTSVEVMDGVANWSLTSTVLDLATMINNPCD